MPPKTHRLPSLLVCDGVLLRLYQSNSQQQSQLLASFADYTGDRFSSGCAPTLLYQGPVKATVLGSGFAYSHVEYDRFVYLCLHVRETGSQRVEVGHLNRNREFVQDTHVKLSAEERVLACCVVEGVCLVLVSSVRVLVCHEGLGWQVISLFHDRKVRAVAACEAESDSNRVQILTLASTNERKEEETQVFWSCELMLDEPRVELRRLPHNLWRIPSSFAAETTCVHCVSELALPATYGQYVLVGTADKRLIELHEGRVVATCDHLPAVPARLTVTPQQLGVALLCILFTDASFHIYGFSPGEGTRQPLRAFQGVGWYFFDDFLRSPCGSHQLLLCSSNFSKVSEWDGKRGVHLTDLSWEGKVLPGEEKSSARMEEKKNTPPQSTQLFAFARSLQARAEQGVREGMELQQEQQQRRELLQRGLDLHRHRPWRPWSRDLVGVITGETFATPLDKDLAQDDLALALDGLQLSCSPKWRITCFLTNTSTKSLQQLSLALRCAGVLTSSSSQWCGSVLPGEGAVLNLEVDPSAWPAHLLQISCDLSAQVHEERKAEGFEWGFDESAVSLELGKLVLPRWSDSDIAFSHIFNNSSKRYSTHNHLRSEVLVHVPPSPSSPSLSTLPQLLAPARESVDGTVPLMGGAPVNFNFTELAHDRAGLTLWTDDSETMARLLHSLPRLLRCRVQLTPWVDPEQLARFLRSLAKETQLVQAWLQEQGSEPHSAHYLFLQQQFRTLQMDTDLLAACLHV